MSIFIIIYVIGSLIAAGMVLAQCFDGVRESKEDYFDMYGHLILEAVIRAIFLSFVFLILAVLFSWLSVGFLYLQGRD